MPAFAERERRARERLRPRLLRLGGTLAEEELHGAPLWAFSTSDGEIPTRNKRIIDLIMARVLIPRGVRNLALGEYVGADTWLVQDHVGASDCDHRSLSAYILHEYGMTYRLISLQDFGESRYKSDRLAIGRAVLGEVMGLTTNCLENVEQDCGACYKCVERAAAFATLDAEDPTRYTENPRKHRRFPLYMAQMQGDAVHDVYHS